MFLFSPQRRYSLFTEHKDLELILEWINVDKCLLWAKDCAKCFQRLPCHLMVHSSSGLGFQFLLLLHNVGEWPDTSEPQSPHGDIGSSYHTYLTGTEPNTITSESNKNNVVHLSKDLGIANKWKKKRLEKQMCVEKTEGVNRWVRKLKDRALTRQEPETSRERLWWEPLHSPTVELLLQRIISSYILQSLRSIFKLPTLINHIELCDVPLGILDKAKKDLERETPSIQWWYRRLLILHPTPRPPPKGAHARGEASLPEETGCYQRKGEGMLHITQENKVHYRLKYTVHVRTQ